MSENYPTKTVAVVGAGPRSLWAVEELSAAAWKYRCGFDITVYDPRPAGVGSTYDPDQPQHRILNVRSCIVRTQMDTLDNYRREVLGESLPLDEFPPRALVGSFLRDSWEHARTHLPEWCSLAFEQRTITSPEELDGFDYVLLVTGHDDPPTPADLIGPYEDDPSIAPGSVVAIRGAALTCVDEVVALTFGRGGQERDGRYIPSGREPRAILPYSRSGTFIQVKPATATDEELNILAPFHTKVASIASVDELKALLLDAASAIHGAPVTWDALDRPSDPVAEMRASVAEDRRPPQALGFVWRELYPSIVERVSFGRMDVTGDFYALTRLLEPFAFGPPAKQIRRLLMLIDAGILSLDELGGTPYTHADAHISAVLAPAGRRPHTLVDAVCSLVGQPDAPFAVTDRQAFLPGQTRWACAGRMTEPYILGNDSLSRTNHSVIPEWAEAVARKVAGVEETADPFGLPPLTGRVEQWIHHSIAADGGAELADALDRFGSPLNILNPEPLARNAAELVDAAAELGVDLRVFFARKANKALAFVDTARDSGHGIDVSSYNELRQVLDAGVPSDRIILSAAVKNDELLRLAISAGCVISVDSLAEAARIDALVAELGKDAVRVAPRLAPDPTCFPATRFGERSGTWAAHIDALGEHIQIVGVHVHLHGYAAKDRTVALYEALALVDTAREHGHPAEFVDIGGGIPMSYLEDPAQWQHFLDYRDAMNAGTAAPFTWKAHPLSSIYPFWQTPVRGEWIREVLAPHADALRSRTVRIHVEPGRSILDGCGATVARVAFIKKRSDGVPLVGLEMNRTQLRTAADDYLIDPLHVAMSPRPGRPYTAFLVGAYCIEDEVIVKRAIHFPQGLSVGDLLVFPNTAGYFMHIVESASHQIPLAHNVVVQSAAKNPATSGYALDGIDT